MVRPITKCVGTLVNLCLGYRGVGVAKSPCRWGDRLNVYAIATVCTPDCGSPFIVGDLGKLVARDGLFCYLQPVPCVFLEVCSLNVSMLQTYSLLGGNDAPGLFCCAAALAACRLALALLCCCRFFSAHDGHLVWSGIGGWAQFLQMPSSFAFWRRFFCWSRPYCLRSVR